MALSTANLPVQSNIKKTFSPGTVYAQLKNITFKADEYSKTGGLIINLHLEGPDLSDQGFEGFLIDPQNPSLGHSKGQTGIVKATQYSFSDGVTTSGKSINRDTEILRFFSGLGKALDKDQELAKISADTIEEYIPKAVAVVIAGNPWLYFTLGGKEYESKGYTNYNLFLVRSDYKTNKSSFSKESDDVVKFNPAIHIIKKKGSAASTDAAAEFEPIDQTDFSV